MTFLQEIPFLQHLPFLLPHMPLQVMSVTQVLFSFPHLSSEYLRLSVQLFRNYPCLSEVPLSCTIQVLCQQTPLIYFFLFRAAEQSCQDYKTSSLYPDILLLHICLLLFLLSFSHHTRLPLPV